MYRRRPRSREAPYRGHHTLTSPTSKRRVIVAPELMTSRSPRVKAARRLTRRAARASARRFLAEGPRSVREALLLPGCVVEVFSTLAGADHHASIASSARAADVPWRLVDKAGFETLTETMSPQGVVAVCRFLDVPLRDSLRHRPRLVVLCAHVRDPGNAGNVIRCADAVGADAVILAGTSVDPYNAKVVRSSVGSLFHLPVVCVPSVAEAVAALREKGISVLAAEGRADLGLDQAFDEGLLDGPTAWLFGNEAWGLPAADAALADHAVGVPIHGRAESLNLAAAAAVCLYATSRAQRS